jgi:hypothetical protein
MEHTTMKPDYDILTKVLGDKPGLKHARITAKDKPYTDRGAALADFLAFPGEGWLCTSEAKSVYSLPKDAPPLTEYPLHGERAEGNRSLHLRQDGAGGWILTTLEESPVDSGPFCLDARLASYSDGVLLNYRVCHEPARTGAEALTGLTELRPVRARFTGFSHSPQR